MVEQTMSSFDLLLDRYAEVAVKVGVGLQRGQQLVLGAPVQARKLVHLICKHAYLSGSPFVHVDWLDAETTLARLNYGDEDALKREADWRFQGMAKLLSEGAARMRIDADDPTIFAGVDPEKLHLVDVAYNNAYKPMRDLITGSVTNWNIVAFAVAPWARLVFPQLSEEAALERLWSEIFKASRVDASVADPIAAWRDHNARLKARMRILNDKRFAALHLRAPGTDLILGLADGHEWRGGSTTAKNGCTGNCNIPTEEVFSTPHRLKVNGVVSSSKPLAYHGNVIEGIRVRFVDGRIVEVHADKGQTVFENLVGTDAGAAHLGEIGLVPHSSPISQSGVLFYETLFDENASVHIAQGQSYKKCMIDGVNTADEALFARGANKSNIHVDWMIGSAAMDIDGVHESGQVEPLMRSGEIVIKE
jgi:aminopeptidase